MASLLWICRAISYITNPQQIEPVEFEPVPGFTFTNNVIYKTGSTRRVTTPPEEDRATSQTICAENLVKFGLLFLDMLADRQTDRHTDTLITFTVFHTPI